MKCSVMNINLTCDIGPEDTTMHRGQQHSSAGLLAFGILLITLFLSGCVSAPEKRTTNAGEGIFITENQSVDLAVRQDFEAAVKLLQEERYAEGAELLKKVIQHSQNNSAPYINLAIASGKLGEIEAAENYLKQALAINPKHPVTLNELALLLRQTGRYTEARQHYENLVKFYPEFMPARRNLGILCELYLNDVPCAIAQYEVYSEANPDDGDVKLWLTTLKR